MKLPFLTIAGLTLAAASSLPAQVSSPSPGFVRYQALPIQTLFGVPGTFVPAPAPFGSADAASFSDEGGLLASNGTLKLIRSNATVVAALPYRGASPVLNSGPSLSTAIAFLPGEHSLVYWNGSNLVDIPLAAGSLDGVVTSVSRASSATATLLTTHPDRTASTVTVSLSSGAVLSASLLPGVEAPAFQFGPYLIWSSRDALEIEQANSFRRTLPIQLAGFTAEQMASHWIHLFSPADGTHWALHLDSNDCNLSRLPVPRPPNGASP